MNIRINCLLNCPADSSSVVPLEEPWLRTRPFFLCDEPAGALDYQTSKEILSLIEEINKKYSNTIIIVTHNDAIKNIANPCTKNAGGCHCLQTM